MVLFSSLKRLIKRLLGFSYPNRTIDWKKTIVFNYFAFGLKGVRILPFYIYKNTRIYDHCIGKINIHCPMVRGLVRIGELDYKSQGETRFINRGIIEIYGRVDVGGCSIIEVDGVLEIHDKVRIADGCSLLVRDKVVIGEQSRIGFHSTVWDSNDHFTVDVDSGKIAKCTKPIIIGAYNWFGSNTIIKKGVVTPDYLIVASPNSLLLKDYSNIPPYSVVGGSPVKLLKSGIRRIYNTQNEIKLHQYFREDSNANDYVLPSDTLIDEFCKMTGDKF